MPKIVLSSGDKFNWLTVIEAGPVNKHKQPTWKCICICGNICYSTCTALRRNLKKSCGCKNFQLPHANRKRSPAEASFYAKVDNLKAHAILRNIIWSLSKPYAVILLKQNCFYCGVEPSAKFNSMLSRAVKLKVPPEHIAAGSIYWNGLDRLDSTSGYTKENTVPCCWRCNAAKNTLGVLEFFNWVLRVVQHNNLLEVKWI